MSPISTGFTEERQRESQGPLGKDYIPTDEERRVFKECNQESFYYRSLPFSVVSMAVTQALITKGALTSSSRFGSLPKVAFAGLCGYLAGKMSYMKTCQEKFKRLEHSPLGQAMRTRSSTPQSPQGVQSELSDPDQLSFESMFQAADSASQTPPHTRDYDYNNDTPVTATTGHGDHLNPPAQSYQEEQAPRRKAVLYEDLRNRNRENYEVTLNQKAENPPTPERPTETPKREAVKNLYGDSWEE